MLDDIDRTYKTINLNNNCHSVPNAMRLSEFAVN